MKIMLRKSVFTYTLKSLFILITDYFRIQYICDICFKSYKYRRGLQTHKRFECEFPGQFKCEKCNRNFNHKQDMKKHFKICKFGQN